MSHHIAILLLAAGGSSRFGSPKQLLPFNGTTLIRYLAEVALRSKADAVYVVVGAEAEKIQPELSGLQIHTLVNDRWKEGFSSSLGAGVDALPEETEAALIMLCDQPLVTTEVLNSIIDTHQASKKPVVASAYADTLGVPVLFARSLFPELLSLRGDHGAKQIIQRHLQDVASVAFPGGAVDIDVPSDIKLIP